MKIKKIVKPFLTIVLVIIAVFTILVALIPVRVVDPENVKADKNGWVEIPLWKSVVLRKNIVVGQDSVVFP